MGRAGEIRFLQDRFLDVVDEGRYLVVDVVGDAGIGKSRLLRDFDLWLAGQPQVVWWFRGRASHVEQNRANSLTRDVIATRMEIAESDPPGGGPREARGRVRHGLRRGRGGRPRCPRRRDLAGLRPRDRRGRPRGRPDRAAERPRPGDRGPGPVLRPAGERPSRSSSCSRTCTGPTPRRCASSTTPTGCGVTFPSWSWRPPAPRSWRNARAGARVWTTTSGSPSGRCRAGRAARWSSSCSRRSTTRRRSSSTSSSTRPRETRSTSRSWSPGSSTRGSSSPTRRGGGSWTSSSAAWSSPRPSRACSRPASTR